MTNEALTVRLRQLPTCDTRLALVISSALASINGASVVWAIVSFFDTFNRLNAAGFCTLGMTLPYRSMRIGLYLAVNAFALIRRTAKGLHTAIASLVLVLLEYFFWYLESREFLAVTESVSFPNDIPHAFNLYGATDWNALVLLVTSVIFVWEAKTYIRARASSWDGSPTRPRFWRVGSNQVTRNPG